MKSRYVGQISPYGCFPAAVINCCIFKDLTPPNAAALVEKSGCEIHRGAIDKVALLRGVRGIHFRRAEVPDIFRSAGIITFGNGKLPRHSAFFFRNSHKTYAVNAQLEKGTLVEPVSLKRFIWQFGESLQKERHWILL